MQFMSSKRFSLCTFVLLFVFTVGGRAQDGQHAVTITHKAPLLTLSPEGTMTGVQEAVVGAKYTWVSTDGANVILADDKGAHYRIAQSATDFVSAPATAPAQATAATTLATPNAAPSDARATTAAATPSVPIAAQTANDTAPDFGPNVTVFDPTSTDVQEKTDAAFAKMETNQFGPERYAFLFKPGEYKAKIQVGFYTQVYGLGKLPDDTTITGEIRASGDWDHGNCTLNFWRGVENIAINKIDGPDMWAVSQAAPFRRVHVKGGLDLFQVVDGRGGWASGGYMADCKVDDRIVPGSQQQWFSRNSSWPDWTNGVWNMVFLGVDHPPQGTWPDKPYTNIEKTPYIREKPFLYIDGGKYSVFLPAPRKDSQGVSWENGNQKGDSIPLSQFYIARSDKDNAATLNSALASGKNLLLTPGVYNLDDTVRVTRPNTIILGLGMPTLSPVKGTSAMEIADVSGVQLCNILFDAGPITSPVLLQVGEPGSHLSHADNPTCLDDIFCRIGGAVVGVTKVAVVINSNDVVGDHAWIWRADHGAGSGWDANKSTNGLIVNGNNVIYYGLFVEHFQEDQTLWNGENGRTYFYQCEMPYDPPTQSAWQHGSVKGWPGYKVADSVKTHEAWGLGIYCVFDHDAIYSDNAVEAPKSPGVLFHHVLTFRLSGATDGSGITSVINGVGSPATKTASRQMVVEYPAP
jgi:hypothetical protein